MSGFSWGLCQSLNLVPFSGSYFSVYVYTLWLFFDEKWTFVYYGMVTWNLIFPFPQGLLLFSLFSFFFSSFLTVKGCSGSFVYWCLLTVIFPETIFLFMCGHWSVYSSACVQLVFWQRFPWTLGAKHIHIHTLNTIGLGLWSFNTYPDSREA